MSDLTVQKLVCDNCGKDLITKSMYPAKYSLELKAINTNIPDGGGQYAVVIFPPIKNTMHFCNLICLGEWCNKEK